ncbi:hypothetical protein J2T09_003058 [Neorhizobium huautlense]|uniref:Uncharacterized protein n=1 Tax=Neorhizobium huautlense TaxID=67774 RepID=A0ABT9PUZ9_9HYPH|nr:hypothetical protein [Neorhizobium huautlense]
MNEGADVMNALRGKQQIADGEYEDMDDVIADMDRIIATR